MSCKTQTNKSDETMSSSGGISILRNDKESAELSQQEFIKTIQSVDWAHTCPVCFGGDSSVYHTDPTHCHCLDCENMGLHCSWVVSNDLPLWVGDPDVLRDNRIVRDSFQEWTRITRLNKLRENPVDSPDFPYKDNLEEYANLDDYDKLANIRQTNWRTSCPICLGHHVHHLPVSGGYECEECRMANPQTNSWWFVDRDIPVWEGSYELFKKSPILRDCERFYDEESKKYSYPLPKPKNYAPEYNRFEIDLRLRYARSGTSEPNLDRKNNVVRVIADYLGTGVVKSPRAKSDREHEMILALTTAIRKLEDVGYRDQSPEAGSKALREVMGSVYGYAKWQGKDFTRDENRLVQIMRRVVADIDEAFGK